MIGIVRENEPINSPPTGSGFEHDYCRMEVFLPELAAEAAPGQFVHLRCGSGVVPFLRRPLSIAGVDRDGGITRFLYEVKGEGSRWLARCRPGDRLDVLGPLGKAFPLDEDGPSLLVAGGIGIAPLLFLARELKLRRFGRKGAHQGEELTGRTPVADDEPSGPLRKSGEGGKRASPPEITVLLGSRTAGLLFGREELESLGIGVLFATDDGSAGYRGPVTELLGQVLEKSTGPVANGFPVVFACGPRVMLAKVARLCQEHGVSGWVSLEEHMACGLGACRGCVVKVRRARPEDAPLHTYVTVCKDGPVFSVREVVWEEAGMEALTPVSLAEPRTTPAVSPTPAGKLPTGPAGFPESDERMGVLPNLALQLAGIELKNPVLSASGTFGFGEEYGRLMDLNQLGAIVVKSVTLEATPGNPPSRVCETPAGMLNSIGWQNPGLEIFLREKLTFLRRFNTPVIVNVAGRTVEEYAEVARRLDGVPGVAALEANISCPNVSEGGVAFGSDPDLAARVTRAMRRASSLPLIVKLSPNVTDVTLIARRVADEGADALSLINALTGIAIDAETQRPVLGNIVGGLTGPAIKPVALFMVWRVAQAVKIPIIGMGGIMQASDAVEFILAGATAVAVGAGSFVNPGTIPQIIAGLSEYLARHGMDDIRQLIAALKPPRNLQR